jgi:hypothetical protein
LNNPADPSARYAALRALAETHLLGKVPDKGTFLYSLTPKGRAAWQEMD